MELILNIFKIAMVLCTMTYGIKVMKEVNTDYQHYFGLGITLLVAVLISLFNADWIKVANTFLWCIAIYFFLNILKDKTT